MSAPRAEHDLKACVCNKTRMAARLVTRIYDEALSWFLEREDSPWYPTMRLFRQPEPGAWQPMMERVADELRALVTRKESS